MTLTAFCCPDGFNLGQNIVSQVGLYVFAPSGYLS